MYDATTTKLLLKYMSATIYRYSSSPEWKHSWPPVWLPHPNGTIAIHLLRKRCQFTNSIDHGHSETHIVLRRLRSSLAFRDMIDKDWSGCLPALRSSSKHCTLHHFSFCKAIIVYLCDYIGFWCIAAVKPRLIREIHLNKFRGENSFNKGNLTRTYKIQSEHLFWTDHQNSVEYASLLYNAPLLVDHGTHTLQVSIQCAI